MEDSIEKIDFLSEIYKALGDPNRLRLFLILMDGVHCNCELVQLTGLANNLISHHMRILVKAGLITARRQEADARWIYYSINREMIDKLQKDSLNFLTIDSIPERNPDCSPEKTCKKRVENEQI